MTAGQLLAVAPPQPPTKAPEESDTHSRQGDDHRGERRHRFVPLSLPLGVCAYFPEPMDTRSAKAQTDQEYRDTQDLRAQQAMACFAEWLFYATVSQFILTCVGTGLLLWSLGLNRQAVRATIRAADAAKAAAVAADASNQIQIDSLRRLERPYLHAIVTSGSGLDGPVGKAGSAFVSFENQGKSTAILERYVLRFQDTPSYPLRLLLIGGVPCYEMIPPSGRIKEAIRCFVESAKPGDVFADGALLLHGLVEYRDQMNALHIDRFCMRYAGRGSFLIEGGEEYNYRRSEYSDGSTVGPPHPEDEFD